MMARFGPSRMKKTKNVGISLKFIILAFFSEKNKNEINLISRQTARINGVCQ